MRKKLSILIVCSLMISSGYVYADDEEDNIDKKLSYNRQEQTTLEDKIKKLDLTINQIQDSIVNTNLKIKNLDSEIKESKEKIKSLQSDINKNQEALSKRLKVIDSNYSIGYLNVILSSTSISDFLDNVYMVKQIVEQDKKILKELDENKKDIIETEKTLSDKKQIQEDLKVSLQENNEKVKADKIKLEDLKDELEKEEDSLEQELEKIAAESAAKKEAELLAKQEFQNSDNLSGTVISSGSWPVPGHTRLSSTYGYRIHPVLHTKKIHTGLDIPAPKGTPAVATDSGTVIFAGRKGTYGNTVMIQHDDGRVSLYAHNDKLLVSKGQKVQKGQVVSKIGTTGRSTGPHLHFEIRVNGKHTNPSPYLG